jgi:hypothetical protein
MRPKYQIASRRVLAIRDEESDIGITFRLGALGPKDTTDQRYHFIAGKIPTQVHSLTSD